MNPFTNYISKPFEISHVSKHQWSHKEAQEKFVVHATEVISIYTTK
jgi:hypothetical protein